MFEPIKEGAVEIFNPLAEGAVELKGPNPVLAEKKAESIWDMSVELEVPIENISEVYDPVEPPQTNDYGEMYYPAVDFGFLREVREGIELEKQRTSDNLSVLGIHIPEGKQEQFELPPKPTRWESVKRFFFGDPTDADVARWTKKGRYEKFHDALSTPLKITIEAAIGPCLAVPQLGWAIIKRLVPEEKNEDVYDMDLSQAMGWAANYNPSGFTRLVAGMANIIGGAGTASQIGKRFGLLVDAGKGADWGAKALRAEQVGAIWGTATELIKKFSGKIDTGTDYGEGGLPGIAATVGGFGVFSMSASVVKAGWAQFLKGHPKFGAKVDDWFKKQPKGTYEESHLKARREILEARRIWRETGDRGEWDRVRAYYTGLAEGEIAPSPTGEVTVKDFGKYPLARPVKAPVVPSKGLKVAPPAAVSPEEPDIAALTNKALKQLSKAERPRELIEVEKTKELGKRAARSAAAAEQATGAERLISALGELKGPLTEYKNPDFTPLKETMSKEEIDALHDDIWKRPHSEDHFDKLGTAKAWAKVVEGFVPTRGEIILLEKQWGKEFAKQLLKKLPLGDRAWDTAADISNFMRTMLAGGDVSVAGRQLRVLGQRYPEEFGKAVKEGLKAYASEDLSKLVRQAYESSPYHREAKKYIQFFHPAGTEAVPPSERPEWYVSHYPEKVPIIGHLIRMGNRNYVETMNTFMQSIWDKLRAQDAINATEPTTKELQLRGKWLMSMSGRPEIGGVVGRRLAPISSGFFFAPRFAVSRFTSPLYLRHLASNDPVAREVGKNTAIAFASFIGTNIAALALLKLAMGDDVEIELDPRSPDWGKGRTGSTRIDLWAGYQQAARFLVQMTLAQYKTQAGDIKEAERLETVGRFVRGKENPLVSLISDLWKGKTYEGDKPFSPPEGEMNRILDELKVPDLIQGIGKEAYRRMLFMWVQDFIDASINDGWPMGFTSGALSFFGNNVSSYEDTAFTKLAKFKDNIAQTEHGKNWEELNPNQQRRLSRINKEVLYDLELQTQIEGARRDDYDYVSKLIEDEKKAGDKVYKKLKPENRKLLDEAGISLGLSRKIGDWEISDERYEQYQQITAEILDEKLSRLSGMEGWSELPVKRRVTKVESAVAAAKDKAKAKVRRASKTEE